MANQPGQPYPQHFHRGQELTARDMNRIVDALIKRISGGKGVNVRVFGNRIVVEEEGL